MIVTKISDGFGNQLFMYACGYALAKKHKTALILDINTVASNNMRRYELDSLNIEYEKLLQLSTFSDCIILKGAGKIQSFVFSHAMHFYKGKINFGYDKEISSVKNNTYISGYWQSEKYFVEYREDLLKLLTPKKKRSKSVNQLYNEMQKCDSIALHVRRGDYVGIGCQLNMAYYDQAISMIKSKYPGEKLILYVFSDDVDFCKHYFPKKQYFATKDIQLRYPQYESDNYTLDDLFLMSHCKHMIMANSSYSWWAAWLNQYKEKTVICPELGMWKWDFYPDDWIKIRCDE